ncbi:MAG: hypothetical protein N2112_06585 [Gemmataceae bacterium]|jgi:hypothetical protein|nr:hypothetical protein [Gemmataceae bacterium]
MKNLLAALILVVNFVPAFAAEKRSQPVLPGEAKPMPQSYAVPAPVAPSATSRSAPIQQVIRAQDVVAAPASPPPAPIPVIGGTTAGCSSCSNSRAISTAFSSGTPMSSTGHGWFGANLREAYLQHICAPDGCARPIGCGNFWTTKKFIFGSCRQFFGTSESVDGHHRGSFIR